MKKIRLIGLAIFLLGLLSYNFSFQLNTDNLTLEDLHLVAVAQGEGGGSGSTCYYQFTYTGKLTDTAVWCMNGESTCATVEKAVSKGTTTGTCTNM